MLARLDPSPGTDVYVYTLESSVYLPNPNSGTTVDQRYEM
jgi:hypothetical protein